jgi:hypothetical protein
MSTHNRVPRAFKRVDPDKWLKYLLLEHFGLSSTSYLVSNIHRFRWSDRIAAIHRLRELLTRKENASALFYVVKYVPLRLQFMLPNRRVYTVDDLRVVEDELLLQGNDAFAEIWFCRTEIHKDIFSVAGRILVDTRNGLESQTIEQVWKCSPRLVETFNSEFTFDYVRAVRPGWIWRPKIVHCHQGIEKRSDFQIKREFYRSISLMRSLLSRIECFCSFLERADIVVYSLEYKIEGSSFRIIDWDTHDDKKLLRLWFDT